MEKILNEMLNDRHGSTEERQIQENERECVCEESSALKPTKVVQLIKKIKNGRSPGENRITGELIKYDGENLKTKINELITKI